MSYTGAISDTTTGLSYMNARYYNPATGSFTSQDTYYGNAYLPKTQHLYSYTGGNPVNYIDPTGHGWLSNAWNSFTNWCSNAWNTTVDTVTSWFTPSDETSSGPAFDAPPANNSNTDSSMESIDPYTGFVFSETANVSTAILQGTLQKGFKNLSNATKPANLDWGSWGRALRSEADEFSSAIATTSKWCKGIAIFCVGIDVTMGVSENIENGASADEIVSDAVVDTVVSGSSIVATAGVIALTGALTGSAVCPVVGTVIGAVVGVAWYFLFDYSSNGEPTLRDKIKDNMYYNYQNYDGMVPLY